MAHSHIQVQVSWFNFIKDPCFNSIFLCLKKNKEITIIIIIIIIITSHKYSYLVEKDPKFTD